MASQLDYDSELAPDLVKLLSSKLNDARKALLDSTEENERLREQLRKCSKRRRNVDASRDSDLEDSSETERLKLELATWADRYERLQDELAGTRLQLQACVEDMETNTQARDVKPRIRCISETCPSRNTIAQLEADVATLTNQLSTQRTSFEEKDAELRHRVDKLKAKYKKYKDQLREYALHQQSTNVNETITSTIPDPRSHEPCFHKSWALGNMRKRIKSPLKGSIVCFRWGFVLPYNDQYNEALMVSPATRCEFSDLGDVTGTLSPMPCYFANMAGTTAEILRLTDRGICYAGTFLCASREEYSAEEFRGLNPSIQEIVINTTVHPGKRCSIPQQEMIRRKYMDGTFKAAYLYLTYQGFNEQLFEELKVLKDQEEQREEEKRITSRKRKDPAHTVSEDEHRKPPKAKKSKSSSKSNKSSYTA